MTSKRNNKTPWVYVPTLYFIEGLPYIIVNIVSVIMYKKMGMSNQFIGLTSILYLPWIIKMFWAPLVDVYKTKRAWIIWTQMIMAVIFSILVLSIGSPMFISFTLSAFILIAFISATHDIAVDGYYILALNKKKQAFFLGVRSTFYRLAVIFGSGILVVLAGNIEKKTGDIPLSWSIVMAAVAIVFLLAFLFHRFYLPCPSADIPDSVSEKKKGFSGAFRTYFHQNKILSIVMFILLYRLGEAMLVKMATPFLLDSPDAGGLGLATDTVGYVYGTVGVSSLAIGGILGGWVISKYGLKKCFLPMAIMLNAPDVLYLYMAILQPSIESVYIMVALEQFGYGLGFTAFSVFLIYIAREPYKTSHFAISTGLMAIGMMLPGIVSGILQNALGYINFFICVLVFTLPGMVLLFFIPLDNGN